MKYESRYVELGFYVNGEYRQFSGHRYATEDADEIAVLDALVSDVVRVEDEEVTEEKPAAKAPAPRKASAKSSAE
ncbi:hypothetical protein [Paenibacillus xanthanilyticus]|uniref:Uncharacterized protein n=1 Tax=Paenibacillus xanthanilyticus TaxID=1783531 RepID=A0ABV8KC62_9BACL